MSFMRATTGDDSLTLDARKVRAGFKVKVHVRGHGAFGAILMDPAEIDKLCEQWQAFRAERK